MTCTDRDLRFGSAEGRKINTKLRRGDRPRSDETTADVRRLTRPFITPASVAPARSRRPETAAFAV